MTMRPEIAVFGAGGQVGQAVRRRAAERHANIAILDRARVDITDPESVRRVLKAVRPDVVVNLAAYTQVDLAEREQDAAFAINCDAAGALAAESHASGAAMIHISTDYVFDGTGNRPYRPDDPVSPVSVYGRSKAAGEEAVRLQCPRSVVVRTSWVYGHEGRNFVKTMLRLAGERDALDVVDDQRGCPTFADDLADGLLDMAARLGEVRDPWGTCHLAGEGETSWCGFARALFDIAAPLGVPKPAVRAISSSNYRTPARRPAWSVLDCTRTDDIFGVRLAPWRDALTRMLTAHLGAQGVTEGKNA